MDIILKPYEGYSYNNIDYRFGSVFSSKKNEPVYKLELDNACDEFIESYSGKRLHVYRNGLLAYVKFPGDQSINDITVGGESISDDNGIRRIKDKYEAIESNDKLKTIIPELGLYIEESIQSNKKIKRSIILFSKFSYGYFSKLVKVIIIYPYRGYTNIFSTIDFNMNPEEIEKIDGKSAKTIIDYQILKDIQEYRTEDIQLNFIKYGNNTVFKSILVMEKNKIKVILNQLSIFEEGDHIKLKKSYNFEDSNNKKLTLFPQLGILTCGCGEKKNKVEGKYLFAFPMRFLDFYRGYLNA